MVSKPSGHLIGANLELADAVARFRLGTTVDLEDGGKAIYCQADGAITGEGYVAIIDAAFQAAQVTTTNADGKLGAKGGVAQMAMADNYYGWFMTHGQSNLRVSASCAAFTQLNTTATAGQLDDDGTANSTLINGVVLNTARGGTAGLAAATLSGITFGIEDPS